MQIINRLIDERYMKKNTSLLTFSVQNVNSSYSEPHSSFNANSKSLKVDQDSFTWMIIFCFVITCLLDNVLALWWEIRSWSLSRYKEDFEQTKKNDFNTFYYMAKSLSEQDKQHPALIGYPSGQDGAIFLKDCEGQLAWLKRTLNQFFADHYFPWSNGWKIYII